MQYFSSPSNIAYVYILKVSLMRQFNKNKYFIIIYLFLFESKKVKLIFKVYLFYFKE